MRVLSLFDGLSCGQIALERAGIKVSKYYAAELDKYAITVTQANYPATIQLGDVTKWREWDIDWASIDLLIGGSPCQSMSNLGDGSGLSGKSGLFYYYFDILNHVRKSNKDVKFLLENVLGKKEAIREISRMMRVQPNEINSNMFSAQNRKRLYWTNIDYEKNIKSICVVLQDILEDGIPDDSILSEGRLRWLLSDKGKATIKKRYAAIDPPLANCLTARSDASWNSNYVTRAGLMTRLTPVEYERLQTVPDNYTAHVSNTQRYKMLGNGWTVDVIAHIFKGIESANENKTEN